MHDDLGYDDEEEWVIWNGNNGLVTTVTLGRVEVGVGGRTAWLEEPFDMVGPFSLDELETQGRIAFAECLVMSRQRWRDDQVELRRESLKIRRAAEQRANEKAERIFGGHGGPRDKGKSFNERRHRETLNLPVDGELQTSEIKAAFRRLAQKAHPDVGGSHEKFVRITAARDALLTCAS